MPDDRLARARTTLPEGFQFGDGGKNDSVCRFGRVFGSDKLLEEGILGLSFTVADENGHDVGWNDINRGEH